MFELMGHSFFMWPIAFCGLVALAIAAERLFYLYFRAGIHADSFVAKIQVLVLAGDIDGAVRLCASEPWAPVSRVARAALLHINADRADLELAVDQASLDAAPLVQRRVGYLATAANVATLFGLLGTIVGLIASFEAVSKADPAEKQAMLAAGISTAMHATASGIAVAIPALIAYAVLAQRSNALLDDVDRVGARMMLLVRSAKNRPSDAAKAAAVADLTPLREDG